MTNFCELSGVRGLVSYLSYHIYVPQQVRTEYNKCSLEKVVRQNEHDEHGSHFVIVFINSQSHQCACVGNTTSLTLIGCTKSMSVKKERTRVVIHLVAL